MTPTVLVVDDDDFLRDVLRRVFVDAGIPVETFASAAQLLATGNLAGPAVLLLDVMMPDMSGIALQALLRERGINLPIIFLTGSSDVPMAVDAMRNGAADFLEKPWNNGELIKRVRMAFALCENPGSRRELPDQEVARRLATLTPREREVAALMVAGMTSKVIARELGGSFRTVEIHRSRVMSKMAATHLADLVRMTFDVERSDRG